MLKSFIAMLALYAVPTGMCAQQRAAQQADLASMNIEDLMNIEITSVSKTEQKLSHTPSAVFVITQEDIRHSGALNIPDLLRMVPGMDVAQVTASTWAISGRGFNGRFSNALLVLLDGRPVYSPTFGGVYWDVVDLPLDDIERIEVIRGPGGSVWGANAVDGVINIITKKASETRGGVIEAGGGNINQGFGTLQYGGSLGSSTDYRVYTKYSNQDHMPNSTGQNGGDGWHLLDGGFRTDSTLSTKDVLTVQGNLYAGSENVPATYFPSVTSPGLQLLDAPANLSGGYIQSVWNHVYSTRKDTTLEASYDNYQRDDELREGRKTLNVDFQNHIPWGDRQDILWGLAFWYSSYHSDGDLLVTLNPASFGDHLFGSFVQDEIALIPDRLYLTAGVKVEHNYFTHWVAMPSARLSWQISNRNTVWAAISRAVHTPAEIDTAIRLNVAGFSGPGGIPALAAIVGNPNFQNENLLAYELGYRTSVSDRVSIDFAAFYNDYSNQATTEPGTPFLESTPAPPHLVIPMTYENLMDGEGHGLEIATNWKVTNHWTLSPGYAFEEIHMHTAPTSQDTTSVLIAEGSSPNHSAQLRSHLDLPHGLGWDMSAYFVDRLASGNIPSYTRLDAQLSWKWGERGSFSLVGQNLLRDHHLEFEDSTQSIVANQIKRSVYTKVNWRF